MKPRTPSTSTRVLSMLAAGSLLFAANAIAQDTSASPPPAAVMQAAPQTATPATANGQSAQFQTPTGEVTVQSAPAAAPTIAPAPSFEQLSGGTKVITETQAAAYPPLANDFLNADGNRNGSISKAEYQRWTKQL